MTGAGNDQVQGVVGHRGPTHQDKAAAEGLAIEVGPQPVAEVDREDQTMGDDDDRRARRGGEDSVTAARSGMRRRRAAPTVGELASEVAVSHGAIARSDPGPLRLAEPFVGDDLATPSPGHRRGRLERLRLGAGHQPEGAVAHLQAGRPRLGVVLGGVVEMPLAGVDPLVRGWHGVANVGDRGHGHVRLTVAVGLTR